MAGYSGTPLPQKLGIKPGFKVALSPLPSDVHKDLEAALGNCDMATKSNVPLDLVLNFVTKKKDLLAAFLRWASRLTPAGMLWIAWPKKSSGVETDLDENKIRDIGLAAGLVDVKVCAISETWSGLKFVRRVKDRAKSAKTNAVR
ncbi:MAG TPA: DUF3052 family protein [Terriglobales bacterium]|nr:DUF3052 family protein [Terriglobales bacterium]